MNIFILLYDIQRRICVVVRDIKDLPVEICFQAGMQNWSLYSVMVMCW